MTNTVELKKAIRESGIKLNYLAKKMGITRTSLSMKINNTSAFKAGEMYLLSEIIGLSDTQAKPIFFNAE